MACDLPMREMRKIACHMCNSFLCFLFFAIVKLPDGLHEEMGHVCPRMRAVL